ncbi:MAG: DUF393 domain-containing protein [Gemmatimonadota bacterium]|nr:DUF393 domain-containing protein [Gemmatimonadota bacterium]
MADSGARYAVIYDGDCDVCSALAARLRRLDRRHQFEIVASQAPGVRGTFSWIPATAFAESLQLVRRSDAATWEGAAAVERILAELPAARISSWIFSAPFARPVAERVYRWFAQHREYFGCLTHGSCANR